MRETIRAACVQLRSSDDVQENLKISSAFIREAHGKGARFIGTPENTCLMAPDGGAKLEKAGASKQLSKAINHCVTDPLGGKKIDGRSGEMKSLKMYIASLAQK